MSSGSSSETCNELSTEIQHPFALGRPTTSSLDTLQQPVVVGKVLALFQVLPL